MNEGLGPTQRKHWRVWGMVFVVFFCGILVGIAAMHEYLEYKRQHREASGLARMKPQVLNHLKHDLHLTDEQVRAIEPLMSQAEAELLQLRMAQQPRVEEIVGRTAATIKSTLSPEQQRPFEEILQTLQQRWDKDRAYAQQHLAGPRP